MQPTTRRRLIAGAIALSAVAILAGCRPNIPLIPGIKSDVRAISNSQATIDAKPITGPATPATLKPPA